MKTFLAVALLATAGVSSVASAETLTFEGQPNTIYDTPQTVSGFTISNPTGDEQHFHFIDSTDFPGFVVSNGTGVLYNDRNTRIDLVSATGGLFSLNTFSASAVGGSSPGSGTTVLNLAGFVGGVQVFSTNYTIGTSFANYTFGNATFDLVRFDGVNGGGGFQLDNVVLNEAMSVVPEPATWALMIAGFGTVGFAMRRRNAVRTTLAFS